VCSEQAQLPLTWCTRAARGGHWRRRRACAGHADALAVVRHWHTAAGALCARVVYARTSARAARQARSRTHAHPTHPWHTVELPEGAGVGGAPGTGVLADGTHI
jgi:hypothetical protein